MHKGLGLIPLHHHAVHFNPKTHQLLHQAVFALLQPGQYAASWHLNLAQSLGAACRLCNARGDGYHSHAYVTPATCNPGVLRSDTHMRATQKTTRNGRRSITISDRLACGRQQSIKMLPSQRCTGRSSDCGRCMNISHIVAHCLKPQ